MIARLLVLRSASVCLSFLNNSRTSKDAVHEYAIELSVDGNLVVLGSTCHGTMHRSDCYWSGTTGKVIGGYQAH